MSRFRIQDSGFSRREFNWRQTLGTEEKRRLIAHHAKSYLATGLSLRLVYFIMPRARNLWASSPSELNQLIVVPSEELLEYYDARFKSLSVYMGWVQDYPKV